MLLSEVCDAASRPLGALGALSRPLLAMNDQIARYAGDRPAECLNDPALALDVLASCDLSAPDALGQLLDFLRKTAGADAPAFDAGITVADALAEFEAGPLALLAPMTRDTYGLWYKRVRRSSLADQPIRPIRPGELSAFVREWLPDLDDDAFEGPAQGRGAAGAATAINALRALWTYSGDQGWADASVAQKVKKPRLPKTKRGPFDWYQQALVRHLAANMHGIKVDPLMALLVALLHQRVLLRKSEIISVPINGVHLNDRDLSWGAKRGRRHTRPFGPAMAAFLRLYIESRRPAGIDPVTWSRSSEPLFRYKPTAKHPNGQAGGVSAYDSIQTQLRRQAPDVFNGERTLHGFRKSAAVWLRQNYDEIVAQTALGHEPDNPSAIYMLSPMSEVRKAMEAYEVWCDTMPPPEPPELAVMQVEPEALATFVPSFTLPVAADAAAAASVPARPSGL